MDIRDEFGDIFWEKITHTKDFIDKIENKLEVIASKKLENKNIILQEIPFDEAFYRKVKTIIDENYSGLLIKESKEQFFFEDKKSFRNNLLKEEKIFHSEHNKCKTKENFVKFFTKHAFKHNINNENFYIWLELYSEKSFDNWVNFISDYMEEKNKNKEEKDKNIVFIISYHNGFNIDDDKVKSNFECFLLEQYITWYDCYVFFTMISNSKYIELNDYFKLYLAELLTNIVRNNVTGKIIELCVECLNNYTNFIEKPNKKIKSIFSECNIGKDINETIYRSQIRVFYPMLNEFRLYFINKYKEKLNDIIKNDKQFLDDMYANDKNSIKPQAPKHFELGKLEYLETKDKIKYNEDYDDSDDLSTYVVARNDLSHKGFVNGYVDFSLLKKIINIFEKKVR